MQIMGIGFKSFGRQMLFDAHVMQVFVDEFIHAQSVQGNEVIDKQEACSGEALSVDLLKKNRIEILYRRKLLKPEGTGKVLPLEHILKKEVEYFPQRPASDTYDIVEIGPGNGGFLLELAQKHPDKKIVAIEIGTPRFEKIKQNLIDQNITNVTLIHGDARVPFYNHFKDATFEKCFVLFPDPWPKNKHRHLRLLQLDFLKTLTRKLKTGGEFTLATDVQDYAEWALENLSQIPEMKNSAGNGQYATAPEDISPTRFQKKWQKMGRSFWYVRFEKI